jgi:hypothetical protein
MLKKRSYVEHIVLEGSAKLMVEDRAALGCSIGRETPFRIRAYISKDS